MVIFQDLQFYYQKYPMILYNDNYEIEGHSSSPFKSSIPFKPILFLFKLRLDKVGLLWNPSTFSIKLSYKLRLDNSSNLSKPYIFVMQFSYKYKHLIWLKFSSPDISLTPFPSKYKTLSPVNSSRFSIYLKPL